MGIVLTGGTIVTAVDCYQADVRLAGEKIVAIGRDVSQAEDNVITVEGCYLLPGGLDPHTHFELEGVTTTADDFASGTAAALTGGTTTILDFATQSKGETLAQALANWQSKAAGKCFADFGFHLAITDWNQEVCREMQRLVVEDGISSFKLYMAYKHNLQVDDGIILQALKRSREVGALIGFHCENGDVIDVLIQEARSQGKRSPRFHALTRPAAVEREATARVITLAELADAPVYIVHLSCAGALQEVIAARARGLEVYAENCPQYLILDESCYDTEDFSAAKYVLSPPLRSTYDQAVLWNGLRTGALDTIGTDHCSFNYEGQKELGREDFSKIPNGIPGVENRLGLLYTYGVLTGKINLQQWVAFTSTNAAKLFGLFPRKGTLAVGSDADIVVWDPRQSSTITVSQQTQRVDYNPYEGLPQTGKVEQVFLRGQQVVAQGKLCSKEPQGQYLFRKPFPTRKV